MSIAIKSIVKAFEQPMLAESQLQHLSAKHLSHYLARSKDRPSSNVLSLVRQAVPLMDGRDLTRLTVSLSRTKSICSETLDVIVKTLKPHLHNLRTSDLTDMLRAVSIEDLELDMTNLFAEIAAALTPRISFLSASDVCHIARYYSSVGLFDRELFTKIAVASSLVSVAMSPAELVDVMTSFAKVRFRNDLFFSKAAFLLKQRTKLLTINQMADALFSIARFHNMDSNKSDASGLLVNELLITLSHQYNILNDLSISVFADLVISCATLERLFNKFPCLIISAFKYPDAWQRISMKGKLLWAIAKLGVWDDSVWKAATEAIVQSSGTMAVPSFDETGEKLHSSFDLLNNCMIGSEEIPGCASALSEYYRSPLGLRDRTDHIDLLRHAVICSSIEQVDTFDISECIDLIDAFSYFPSDSFASLDPLVLRIQAFVNKPKTMRELSVNSLLKCLTGFGALSSIVTFEGSALILNALRSKELTEKQSESLSRLAPLFSNVNVHTEITTETVYSSTDGELLKDVLVRSGLQSVKTNETIAGFHVDCVDTDERPTAYLILGDDEFIRSSVDCSFLPRLHVLLKKRIIESRGWSLILIDSHDWRSQSNCDSLLQYIVKLRGSTE